MRKKNETAVGKEKFRQFLEYTKNQIFELLDNYSRVKGSWFGGTWDVS